MASNKVPVAGQLGTTSPTDTYPVFEDVDGLGGFRVVANENAMNAIPAERRKEGMEVKLENGKLYELKNGIFVLKTSIGDIQPLLDLKEDKANKNQPNGYAGLGSDGKVLSSQLPSYIDDIVEYPNKAAFPTTGNSSTIYVDLSDGNKQYRWSGTAYAEISSGAVQSVNGKTGIVNLVKADIALGNVDNTSDLNKPISTATQAALDGKADLGHNHSGLYEPANANIQAHIADTSTNPHNVTKQQVGLGSVDNTADNAKNVLSATKFTTSRKINQVPFNGTSDIRLPFVNPFTTTTQSINVDINYGVYKLEITSNTNISIGINSNVLSYIGTATLPIEIELKVKTVSTVTWPSNIIWVEGNPPSIASEGMYRILLTTDDSGTNWVGRLLYKIDLILTDLDILRQIRDANPTSQLPALWMDSEDPYTQWEGVTWRTIGIKKYVKYLSIYNDKQIYSLPNVKRLTYLQELLCFNNSISVLDISEMPTLSRISCDRNEMTQLKVENSPNLYDISCYQNKIKYLDLKGITRVALEAGDNLLESVIFYSPVITRLGLNSNKLTSIPTLISKSEIVYYTFVLNNFPTAELDRFRAMGFTDESKLLPQNP